jgi:hypothetical protein
MVQTADQSLKLLQVSILHPILMLSQQPDISQAAEQLFQELFFHHKQQQQ